jgi:hypothetical protein
VILGRNERLIPLAVGQHEVGDLGSLETFLEDDPGTGVAECALEHRRAHRVLRRLPILGDHDALPGGEAVRLDDHCWAERIGAHELQGFISRVADAVSRGRHRMARHELLGERLARLQLCRGSGRAEEGPADLGKPVSYPSRQRRFRSDNREIRTEPFGERLNGTGIAERDQLSRERPCDSRVTGRAPDPLDPGVVGETPAEGVLARAGTEDEDAHRDGARNQELGTRKAAVYNQLQPISWLAAGASYFGAEAGRYRSTL